MPKFEVDVSDRKPVGNTGETVSAVGLGTWAIRDYKGALSAYIEAFSLGIDNVDTAEMYDDGKAEKFVGELVRRVGRDKVFITTKLLPHRFRSRDSALKAMKLSLERLGVNNVDLILIHWPDTLATIEDQARNLEALVFEGLTRYIGVSNFTAEELERARQALRRHDVVVNQVKYSILDKSVEEELLPYVMPRGITIQAYTPLERGEVLTHKTINEIARKTGKTPAQVALNYLISRPRVVVIPKAEKKDHVREIAGAMGWRLSPEDIEVLEAI